MKSPIVILFLVLLSLFVFVHEIPAQVYKYVDKDGVTNFTDTPTDKKFQKESSVGWDNSVRSEAGSRTVSRSEIKRPPNKTIIPKNQILPIRIDITPPPNTPAHLTEMRDMPGMIPPPNTPQHLIRMK